MRSSMAGPAYFLLFVLLVGAIVVEVDAVVVGPVVGQDPVQRAPGLLKQSFGGLDLLGSAGPCHLHDAAAELGGMGKQGGYVAGSLLAHRLPRSPCHPGVVLDIAAARVGKAERAAAAGLRTSNKSLVSQQGQGRIDSAGAGPPDTTAALLDLGHDLISGAWAFPQQGQDRGAHVATAGLGASG